MEYNDGLRSGGRYPTLWIIHHGVIHTFEGSDITGVARIMRSDYYKKGKWSNTTFDIELASGAQAVDLCPRLHQRTWPENDRMAAYQRFLAENDIAVSFDAFCEALARDYPPTVERMLESERLRETLSGADGDTESVSITVCKYCRRDPHQDVLITFGDNEYIVAHEAPIGTKIGDIAVLTGTEYQPGYRDGYTTLTFEVAMGAAVTIYYYDKDGDSDPSAIGREDDETIT